MSEEALSENVSENRTVVLVIGNLGELMKKSIETDFRAEDNPKDRLALLESASLRKLIEEWPVIDENKVHFLWLGMRMSLMKLRQAEKDIKEMLPKTDRTVMELAWFNKLVAEMFKHQDTIRTQIAELNKLSGGIGKASAIPPDAELVIVRQS